MRRECRPTKYILKKNLKKRAEIEFTGKSSKYQSKNKNNNNNKLEREREHEINKKKDL